MRGSRNFQSADIVLAEEIGKGKKKGERGGMSGVSKPEEGKEERDLWPRSFWQRREGRKEEKKRRDLFRAAIAGGEPHVSRAYAGPS